MGKQKGDAARSKTRPSSSNLAASLLQSGTTSVGFGGYVGSSRIDSTSTTESNSLLLKALSSLAILFKQNSVSELSQIVPLWVFEYKRLVLDNSRHVRQAAEDAMANFAVTIGWPFQCRRKD